MVTTWIFNSETSSTHPPRLTSQAVSINGDVLVLRNPWVTDSVFMAKLYLALTLCLAALIYPDILNDEYRELLTNPFSIARYALSPLILMPFLAYRIYYIRNLSAIYLNRNTQSIYYKRIKKLIKLDWHKVGGGVSRRTEFGGASFSTHYALAFAQRRTDGSFNQRDALWIDSNDSTESDVKHVAEAWEYLRHFMNHGPDKLPPFGEPNWLYRPLHEICLTPAQAWQHYAPWRTGEPGEMQGKKTWLLPIWAVLFPYNLSLAICWYVMCRVFNIRTAPPPAEAFEQAPVKAAKRARK
ncbi:hypothetical protein GIB23_13790 [Pseudomonas putida]|uniref:DUF6708 domain-containing protein n=1 Tax=Pseudomonas putida TaxID=303 RepID=UPI001A8C6DAD|nr:hypothetical protein [Pseudomonas putida]